MALHLTQLHLQQLQTEGCVSVYLGALGIVL